MKARPRGDGARLHLSDVEIATVSSLFDDLAEALAPDGLQPGDPVYDRLDPDGYSGDVSPQAQGEFRDLTLAGLRDSRLERLDACRSEVGSASEHHGRVDLDADGCDRWIRVLNDLRLSLGTRLNISDDDQHWDIRPDSPDAAAYLLYGWLTEVQDTVVRIASR